MSHERDGMLESLFAEAAGAQTLKASDTEFTDSIMASVDSRKRNILFGRISIVALIVLFEMFLSFPMQNSVGAITATLSTSLIDLNSSWVAMLVEPVNSIAGVIGILLLGMHALYRRMNH